MDIIPLLLILLVIAVVLVAVFALVRSKQRAGSVLAAPDTRSDTGRGGQR